MTQRHTHGRTHGHTHRGAAAASGFASVSRCHRDLVTHTLDLGGDVVVVVVLAAVGDEGGEVGDVLDVPLDLLDFVDSLREGQLVALALSGCHVLRLGEDGLRNLVAKT